MATCLTPRFLTVAARKSCAWFTAIFDPLPTRDDRSILIIWHVCREQPPGCVSKRFVAHFTLSVPPMPNAFDPYREAVVVETNTIWPEEYEAWDASDRGVVEAKLHADPKACTEMDYVRMHTGFCREIKVTAADLQRIGVV